MTMKVLVGGVYKTVSKISVCRSGAWKEVSRAHSYNTHGDPATVGWRQFYVKAGPPPVDPPPPTPEEPPPVDPPITLSLNANFLQFYGYKASPPFNITTSPSCVITPTNGTPPYTYKWTLVSYDYWDLAPSATAPNSNTTAFSQRMNDYQESCSASFRCTVTDSKGNTGTVLIQAGFSTGSGQTGGGGGGGGGFPIP